MNWRRGYLRLSVAAVGAWIAVWGTIGGYAAWQQSIWTDIFLDESRSGVPLAQLAEVDAKQSEYGELVATALMWGLLAVPIALTFALGWWVLRGFFPPTSSADPSQP